MINDDERPLRSIEAPSPKEKIRAEDIPPTFTTELGYAMYVADNSPHESEIRAQARQVIREFDELARQFARDTPEGLYVFLVRTYATALGRSLTARRRTKDRRMDAAQQQWDIMRSQIASQAHWAGLLNGAWQIMLLGGFAFIAVRFAAQKLLGVSGIAEHIGNHDVTTASLATTMAVCLIGSYFKSWSTKNRINKLRRRYDGQITGADREYKAQAKIEYDLCSTQSAAAWLALTHREELPKQTRAFNTMIQGLVAEQQYGAEEKNKKQTIVIRTVRTVRTIIRHARIRQRNGIQKKEKNITEECEEHF